MDNTLGFSVLLSVYAGDNALHFERALLSIKEQTCQPSEIVIVNDGLLPQDLYKVQKDFIQNCNIPCEILPLSENVGLGEALRRGLEKCNFRWVARMDADDISRPNRFERQIDFLLKHPDTAMIGGYIEEFEEGRVRLKKVPCLSQGISRRMSFRNPFNHVTVIMDKLKVEAVGSYQSCEYFEDYFLWARMYKAGFKLYNMPVVLVDVRVGSDMIGRRHGWVYVRSEWNILQKLRELKIIKTNIGFLLRFILKSVPRLLPRYVLALIYKRILR